MARKGDRESTENPGRGYDGIATSVVRYSPKGGRSVANASTIDARIAFEYRMSATTPLLVPANKTQSEEEEE
jgi:hypothetical protein